MLVWNAPLEQFQQYLIFSFKISTFLNFSVFTSIFTQYFLIFLILTIFYVVSKVKIVFISKNYQSIIENIFTFIYGIILSNIGAGFVYFFPFVLCLFIIIFASNIFGMIPFTFTLTSHIIITFTLALMTFFGLNFLGIKKHGWHFFSLFLPQGVPLFIAPFLIVIEIISYIARVFSLGIRLFANMMAGHTLMKILAGFGWSMWQFGGLWFVFGIIPAIIIFLVTGLELAIAFLQAYVFIILVCIYINDCIHLH